MGKLNDKAIEEHENRKSPNPKIIPIPRNMRKDVADIVNHKNNSALFLRSPISLTKKAPLKTFLVQDISKRNFIKKGILGLIAGVGIAAFSKAAHAAFGGFIKFPDSTTLATDR